MRQQENMENKGGGVNSAITVSLPLGGDPKQWNLNHLCPSPWTCCSRSVFGVVIAYISSRPSVVGKSHVTLAWL